MDSALPTGGFVGSAGLEAAMYSFHANPKLDTNISSTSSTALPGWIPLQDHPIRDSINRDKDLNLINTRPPTSLQSYIRHSIHNFAMSSLPYVYFTWKCINESMVRFKNNSNQQQQENTYIYSCLKHLDSSYDSIVGSNHVGRRASRALGAGFLTMLEKGLLIDVRDLDDCEVDDLEGEAGGDFEKVLERKIGLMGMMVLKEFKRDLRAGKTPGHMPVAFGITCRYLGIPLEKTLYIYVYQHARSLVSAAVRLNMVGPFKGQRLLMSLQTTTESSLEEVTRRIRDVEMKDGGGGVGDVEDEDEFWIGWNDYNDCELDNAERYARLAGDVACQTSPVGDIVQGLHDRLYS
ncbi:hypothetical protein HDU76_010211, partial [Blyttiomyces sp. JEL0837]